MSNKSKKLNKAFPEALLSTARKIADKYEIIVSSEDGEWFGKGLEMPAVFGDGKTPDECIKNTREALIAAVAHLLEQNEKIPAPASQGTRDAQVNVRLNAEEKAILTAYAHAHGFSGLADFIRATALNHKMA